MRRLTNVAVAGLLGRFDHEIAFPEDWEFTILYGPNGIGKTRLLEIIAHTFSRRTYALLNIPFRQALFQFSDGYSLTLTRSGQGPLLPGSPEAEEDQGLEFHLQGVGIVGFRWMVGRGGQRGIPARAIRDLERYLPIEAVAPDVWQDQRTGDYLSLADVADRFSEDLPFDLGLDERPSELREFLESFDVHLIETQRLLSFHVPTRAQQRRPSQRATVLQFGEDLTRRIREALAHNSRTSQERDRTFPRRVLTEDIPSQITDEQIRARYEEQSELRRRLAEISVLDPSGEMPLPSRPLENWERRVLWTYLDDSERKLSTFQTLLDRVRLLREIVNSRFLFKELLIDAEVGFRFVAQGGGELATDQLSSGEQHELVLLYDLLFNVRPNSLVLVDEPEISLHVAWQQRFLSDIQRIAALADLRFVVATHSPQIIHTWWKRAVALYKSPDEPEWFERA